MKKLTSIASVLAFFAMAFFAGCSSNDDPLKPTPIESGDYFPRIDGSYWLYTYYTTDSNGVDIVDSKRIDSTWVEPAVSMNAKLCNPLHTITSKGGESVDYFYGDTNKLFALSDYIFLKKGVIPIDLPSFPQRWMKIADFAVETETSLFDTTIASLVFKWGKTDVNINNVSYRVTTKKSTDKFNILVDGKSLPSYCFIITHYITGKITYKLGTSDIPFQFSTSTSIKNYY